MPNLGDTLTIPELAARCGIDATTARRYLRAGQLPGVELRTPGSAHGRWLIDRRTVDRFLAGEIDAQGKPRHAAPAPALTVPSSVPSNDERAAAAAWLRQGTLLLTTLADLISERQDTSRSSMAADTE